MWSFRMAEMNCVIIVERHGPHTEFILVNSLKVFILRDNGSAASLSPSALQTVWLKQIFLYRSHSSVSPSLHGPSVNRTENPFYSTLSVKDMGSCPSGKCYVFVPFGQSHPGEMYAETSGSHFILCKPLMFVDG